MRGYRNFNTEPKPGDLRHLVTIGKTTNVINENGYPDSTDEVICRVWAGADDAGFNLVVAADAKNIDDTVNFVIRYRPDVKVGMWLEFENERRVIEQLGRYGYKKAYLGLKTTYGKAV